MEIPLQVTSRERELVPGKVHNCADREDVVVRP